MTEQADQSPIANIEAEAALIGALMMANNLIDAAANRVTDNDFYEPLLGRVFRAIVDMHSMGKSVSPVTLAPLFRNDAAMSQLGGPGYLAQLTGYGAPIIGALDFADQIAMLAKKRRLVENLTGVIQACHTDDRATPEELMAEAETAIEESRGKNASAVLVDPGKVADAVAASMGQEVKGVLSPRLGDINRAIGKICRADLVIGAARPGMGKTAFANSYALGAAMAGYGVGYINMEMSDEQQVKRMLADLCYKSGQGVPYNLIRDQQIKHDDHFALFDDARRTLGALPLIMVNVPALTIARANSLARQMSRRFEANGKRLDLLVIDYLQLMSGSGRRRDANRVEEVSEISRGLKILAGEMQCGVLALSQLSRAVEARDDKRPRLNDLRESGSIEQDADTVFFLYRPEYYLDQSEPEPDTVKHDQWRQQRDACANVLEVIAGKKRHGRTGIFEGRFYGEFQAVRGPNG